MGRHICVSSFWSCSSVGGALPKYEQATMSGAASMERWTKAQTLTGVILAMFTMGQVMIAVLEYMKP